MKRAAWAAGCAAIGLVLLGTTTTCAGPRGDAGTGAPATVPSVASVPSDQFTQLVGEVRRALPGFVDARWDNDRGVLTVQPGSLDAARAMAAKYAVNVSVVAADRPTEAEQQSLVEAVARSLNPSVGHSVVVGYDLDSNAVIATVYGSTPTSPARVSPDVAAQAAKLGVAINVVDSEEPGPSVG